MKVRDLIGILLHCDIEAEVEIGGMPDVVINESTTRSHRPPYPMVKTYEINRPRTMDEQAQAVLNNMRGSFAGGES